jgi:membrane protease YdiL (CAAX protease family)
MMPPRTELVILIAAAVVIIIGGALLTVQLGWKSLLPPQRWRDLPNLGVFCWFLFLVFWIPAPLIAQALKNTGHSHWQHPISAGLWANLLAFPTQMALAAMGARFLLGNFWRLGFPARRRWWPAIALGFASCLAFFLPTMCVNLIVREIVYRCAGGPRLSEHPLIQSLMAPTADSAFWILITIESIFLAPIREELFFRGAMQPWLIRQKTGGTIGIGIAAGAAILLRGDANSFWSRFGPPAYAIIIGHLLLIAEPLAARIRNRLSAVGQYLFPTMQSGSTHGGQVYRGIVGSGLVFAMFHSSSWPDPIPLTVLGLGLGWLAWRTQGIVAPIVCHALFNASTIFQLRVMALLSA